MTEIESPLGRTSFASSGAKRVYTVDDHSQGQSQAVHPAYQQQGPPQPRQLTPQEMEEFTRQRQMAQQAKHRISDSAKKRVEFLTNIGRIRDSFEMDGVTFHLRSLKSKELEEIHDIMLAMGETTSVKLNMEVRRQVLARSLYSIDSMTMFDIIGSDDLNDKVDLIDSLDENLVVFMHKFYEENIMKIGREKYAVKSKEEMQQLVDDVKKS